VFKCGRTQILIYINQFLEAEPVDGNITIFLRPGYIIKITPPDNWYKSLVGVFFDLMANYEQRAPNDAQKMCGQVFNFQKSNGRIGLITLQFE